jgi:hypothetical protein
MRKAKTFESFVNDKSVNLSGSSKANIGYSIVFFDEFCQKIDKRSFDKIINEAKKDEHPDKFISDVILNIKPFLQSFISKGNR